MIKKANVVRLKECVWLWLFAWCWKNFTKFGKFAESKRYETLWKNKQQQQQTWRSSLFWVVYYPWFIVNTQTINSIKTVHPFFQGKVTHNLDLNLDVIFNLLIKELMIVFGQPWFFFFFHSCSKSRTYFFFFSFFQFGIFMTFCFYLGINFLIEIDLFIFKNGLFFFFFFLVN